MAWFLRKLGDRSDQCEVLAMHRELRTVGGHGGWECVALYRKLSKDSGISFSCPR